MGPGRTERCHRKIIREGKKIKNNENKGKKRRRERTKKTKRETGNGNLHTRDLVFVVVYEVWMAYVVGTRSGYLIGRKTLLTSS